MTSAPSGQRLWKCPECGGEVMLSVVQLDPIACDACLHKRKGKESSRSDHSTAVRTTGPLGIWSSLPETTKLGVVVAALLVGLVIGFKLGSESGSGPAPAHRAASHPKSTPVEEPESHEDSTSDPETEERPEPPGPGYKWVKGRKHKDGTYGKGHWAKDPRASDSK